MVEVMMTCTLWTCSSQSLNGDMHTAIVFVTVKITKTEILYILCNGTHRTYTTYHQSSDNLDEQCFRYITKLCQGFRLYASKTMSSQDGSQQLKVYSNWKRDQRFNQPRHLTITYLCSPSQSERYMCMNDSSEISWFRQTALRMYVHKNKTPKSKRSKNLKCTQSL